MSTELKLLVAAWPYAFFILIISECIFNLLWFVKSPGMILASNFRENFLSLFLPKKKKKKRKLQ